MAKVDKGGTVRIEELLVASLSQSDTLSKLLIEKALIIQKGFVEKLSKERATYQAMLEMVR